jgi:hypothetical protein
LKKRGEQAFGKHDSISVTVVHRRDDEPLRQGIKIAPKKKRPNGGAPAARYMKS